MFVQLLRKKKSINYRFENVHSRNGLAMEIYSFKTFQKKKQLKSNVKKLPIDRVAGNSASRQASTTLKSS